MAFRSTNMIARPAVQVMGNMQQRSFGSLPEHIVMEMPNLSPTMEKVSLALSSTLKPQNNFYVFFHREISRSGSKRLEMRSSQVMHYALLKLIRQLLIMKCKKRVLSLHFFSSLEPRTFLLVKALQSLLRTKRISQLLQTTTALPLLKQQQPRPQPLHKLLQHLSLLQPLPGLSISLWRCLTCHPRWRR